MPAKIDDKWFRLHISRAGYSQRQFAAKVGLDPASLVRALDGKRRLQPEEVTAIAQILNIDLAEVSRRAWGSAWAKGLGSIAPSAQVTLVEEMAKAPTGGTIDATTGAVKFTPTRASAKAPIVALVIEGDPFMAGWRVLCCPSDVSATPDAGVTAGIVQTKDDRLLFRKIRKAFSPGCFDLGPVLGFGDQENGVELVGVVPVVGLER